MKYLFYVMTRILLVTRDNKEKTQLSETWMWEIDVCGLYDVFTLILTLEKYYDKQNYTSTIKVSIKFWECRYRNMPCICTTGLICKTTT
jgi:hypothetical protein